MTRNLAILKKEITALSVATSWDEVLTEWRIDSIEDSDDPKTCLCSHTPILELCFLINVINRNKALVGNVCVNNFLGMNSEPLFAAYRIIARDSEKATRPILIQYARDHSLINDWEFSFLMSIASKRSLTVKQMKKRVEVNTLLVSRIRNTEELL